ncbi:hypothetical protein [Methanothermococcus okinawensis]|uniref:hypothetical protein n=1 Tax=Methanothermococcus okinawensis TaxID=155863 RepID=UPI0012F69D34|nr:hypothetical protein [Methanothermococcus okinawensis]
MFRNDVQMIIERGQSKAEDGKYYPDDSKEGRITLFLDSVHSYKKKDGSMGYIVNIPISILKEFYDAMVVNESFKEFFDCLYTNGKIWELKSMLKRGASESTIRCYAKDLGLSDDVVDKVLSGGE